MKPAEPIAIVGMACRLPGGPDVDAFWHLLAAGGDAIDEVPADRGWDKSRFYDPDPRAPGRTYVWQGGFIADVDRFDPAFFGIAPREAVRMDPQQRLLLEGVWRAFEDAGIAPARLEGTATGVYVGISTNDFLQIGCSLGRRHDIDAYSGTGTAASIAAGRISYCLGLQGPNFPVDTACSSALVALHQACQSLRSGECDTAVTAAVNLMLSPETTVYFSKVRALAPDGRCRTFDAAASGYVRSEGVAAVVLRRLDDAVRDGQRILAVIRGSAVNHDGRTTGLTVPNGDSQERLLRRALAAAGIAPRQMGYVEAHGTGTPLGDPIEVRALGGVFAADRSAAEPLVIGSVKTNIGHTEAVAGLAGLIKVVLALKYRTIPRHLHFTDPSPHVPWPRLPIRVAAAAEPWRPIDGRWIAGVSSFGFSGTNAHVIVEAARDVVPPSGTPPAEQLLVLSAKTPASLGEAAASLAARLREPDDATLADVCFTAAHGRSHFAHRTAARVSSRDEAAAALARVNAAASRPAAVRPRQAWLFPGDGPGQIDAGAALYAAVPAFCEGVEECAAAVADILERPLTELLFAPPPERTTAEVHAGLFAIEYALLRMWTAWGLRPAVVAGHSIGEFVAACAAGVMSPAAAVRFVARRGVLLDRLTGPGGLVAVAADHARTREIVVPLGGSLAIGAENSAANTVVAGTAADLDRLEAALTAGRVAFQRLAAAHAYHTRLMDPVVEACREEAERLDLHPPRLGMVSGVTGRLATAELARPDYWAAQVREPVRFRQALDLLHGRGYRVFLEVGPAPVLAPLGRHGRPRDAGTWLASLNPARPTRSHVLDVVRQLYEAGVDPDWRAVWADEPVRLTTLPGHPFARIRCVPDGFDRSLPTEAPADPAVSPTPGEATNGASDVTAEPLTPAEASTRCVRHDIAWEAITAPVAADAAQATDRPAGGSWLVLAADPDDAFTRSLAAAIERRGEACTCVARDALPDREACTRMLADHDRRGLPPLRGVVVACPTIEPTAAEPSAAAARAVGVAVHLVAALARHAPAGEPRLVLVTRGAQEVERGAGCPGWVHAGLWGLGRVVPLEHPRLACLRIDLDPEQPDAADDDAAIVLGLAGSTAEDQVAVRGGRLFAPRLVEAADATAGDPPRLDPAAAYLVTGGLGSLGRIVAEWLVDRGARRLCLVGRRPPTTRAADWIAAMSARGATIEAVACDVADAAAVERLVTDLVARSGRLAGVIHAAGVLDDAPLAELDERRCAAVLAPKVAGGWNLHRATADHDLDFFVAFSSVAATLGSPQQAAYAAANAALDALASHRRQLGLPGLAIAWGPWADDGMAARMGERQLRGWSRLGLEPLATAEALTWLDALLGTEAAQTGIFPVDWSQALRHVPTGLEPPLLRGIARRHRRELPPSSAWRSLCRDLRALPPTEHHDLVSRYVERTVADVLGHGGDGGIDVLAGFTDLGMDSLMAVDLRARFQTDVGLAHPLSITLLLDHPSIDAVARHLVRAVVPAVLGTAHADVEPADASALSPGERTAAVRAKERGADVLLPGHPHPGPLPEGEGDEATGVAHRRARATAGTSVAAHNAVAIVGMGMRFPGGAVDADSYWRLLADGVDAIREVPRSRWDVDRWYDADPDAPGTMNCRHGGFLDDVETFDAAFFGISPREALRLDPQHRLVLEVAVEALEQAKQPLDRLVGSASAVFLGLSGDDYLAVLRSTRDPALLDGWLATGNALSIAAGRVSHALGWRGPCLTVDTACSSSLVAVHLAVECLRAGKADLALAGGVGLLLSPEVSISLTKARALSADGRCKTFDASADGYVRGEGCGLVALKRLDDAVRDGDPILAVIRGTAINHDGRSSGLTVPNVAAQESLLRAALADAGLDAAAVDYLEAHGTGTPLGDPIELQAVQAVYGAVRPRGRPLLVGSVKTNVGHLEAAAGVAGLVKTVLALQHGAIPPHLHLRQPSPAIPWADLAVEVPTILRAWPAASPIKRAAVSSFGFAGTNAHVVLEEPPATSAAPHGTANEPPATSDAEDVLCLSAKSPAALAALAGRYAAFLARGTACWGDVCFSAAAGRAVHQHRLAVIAGSAAEALEPLEANAAGRDHPRARSRAAEASRRPKVAFLFTGQGSQYVGMGRGLFAANPVFRDTFERCDAILRERHGLPLLDAVFPRAGAAAPPLDRTDVTQVAIFCLEVALFRMWEAWGVRPSAVLGHSVGEFAAACAAGVFSLDDGLRLVTARGRLMEAIRPGGAMAAILAPRATVEAVLVAAESDAEIAAVNGPRNTVVSGGEAAVAAVLARCQADGLPGTRLAVSHACHSRVMEPMLAEFAAVLADVELREPTIGLVSNVFGRFAAPGEVTRPEYWCRHVREPVQFAAGIRALAERHYSVFLELGPDAVLAGMGRHCVEDAGQLWQCGLRRRDPDGHATLEVLRDLFLHGVAIDWRNYHRAAGRRWADIPGYPFQRQRFWPLPEGIAPDAAVAAAAPLVGPGADDHPFLGRIFETEALSGVVFDTVYDERHPPFVAEHQVHGLVVVPGAAYLAMAVAAARHRGRPAVRLDDVVFPEPMFLAADEGRRVQVAMRPDAAGEECRVTSQAADGTRGRWRMHARGTLRDAAPDALPTLAAHEIQGRCGPRAARGPEFYDALSRAGVQLGGSFRWNAELWRRDGEALTRLEPPAPEPRLAGCPVHPGLLDACIQAAALCLPFTHHDFSAYVPVGIDRFTCHADPAGPLWCHTLLREDERAARGAFTSDVRLHDESGRLVIEFVNLRMQRAPRTAIMAFANRRLRDWMYRLAWVEKPRPAAEPRPASGRWLVLTDGGPLGQRVARSLEARGADCAVVSPGREFRAAAGRWRIDPADPGHWARLVGAEHGAGPVAGVVSLWPLTGPSCALDDLSVRKFDAAQAVGCRAALHLLQALARTPARQPPRVALVTRGAQATGRDDGPVDVAQAAVWGLARVAALEMPQVGLVRLDLSSRRVAAKRAARATADDAERIVAELLEPDGDDQIAFRGDSRLVARLARGATGGTRGPHAVGPGGSEPYRLARPASRAIEDLEFQPVGRLPPAGGEVEIAVRATGLNFRDVLNTLGLYPGEAGPLGFECAGVVSAAGPDVRGVQVGDRVLALAPGALGPFVLTDSRLVVPIPADLDFTAAATLPIVFLTVAIALGEQGRLAAGDTVLVPSAAGGVGLAAVQLAARVGARVVATAGSAEKRAFLRGLGIEHVFDSRSREFPEQVREATGGRGVDVVVNALPGEHVGLNLAALATGGRFVEIGKSDTWTTEGWAERRPDVRYSTFALDDLSVSQPGLVAERLRLLVADVAAGRVKPLPRTEFGMERVKDAFRFMAQSRHVGKVVVTQPDFAASRTASQRVHAAATYLVTGGLGALGLLVARWLVDHGARHLVLVGRRPPDAEAARIVAELEALGARVVVARADLAEPAQLRRLVRGLRRRLPPLAGVVHAAGVLDDGMLLQQDWGRFERVMRGKVRGAVVLHELSREAPLDWMILFSSIAATWGSPGQGNYAAANAALDALAQARRQRDLPAIAIDWGPWADVGMAARMEIGNRHWWQVAGIGTIPPAQGMTALEMIVQDNPVQVAVLSIDWHKLASRLQAGGAPALIADLVHDQLPAREASREWREFVAALEAAPPAERVDLLVRHIQQEAARVLGLDAPESLDPHAPLQDLGFDSLMAVELANQMTATTGMALPVTLLVDHPTLHAVAGYVVTQVLGLDDGRGAVAAVTPPRSTRADPVAPPAAPAARKRSPSRRPRRQRSRPRRRAGCETRRGGRGAAGWRAG